MKKLLQLAAAAAILLSPVAARADSLQDMSRKVIDAAFKPMIEQQIEARYWQATEGWLKEQNAQITAEQLAELREVGKSEVPGAYDYVVTPAAQAIAGKMSEADMTAFVEQYKPESRDAFKSTPLGQKFGAEVVPAFMVAMNGPVNDLMVKRLGNYRMAIYMKAVEKNYVPKQ